MTRDYVDRRRPIETPFRPALTFSVSSVVQIALEVALLRAFVGFVVNKMGGG